MQPAPAAGTRRIYSASQVDLELARKSFRHFVQQAWHLVDPAPLVWTWGMEAICEHLAWWSRRDIRNLMINILPRQGKSTTCSVLFQPWEWIDNPGLQYLTGSYAIQLAQRDARKSRALMQSKWYQDRWGKRFKFTEDENLKRQYSNDKGGRRVVTSTDATATGEGGNRVMLDDPHNVREAESEQQRQNVIDFWDGTLSSRLNQANVDGWMAIGQMTHPDDLFSHIVQTTEARDYCHLILTNEYDRERKCITYSKPLTKEQDEADEKWEPIGTEGSLHKSQWRIRFSDPREKKGELFNPDRLDRDATNRLKRRLGDNKYALQYQQDKHGGGGRIMKRDFWKRWKDRETPICSYIFSVWDTALSEKQEADYSAVTDWGLFLYGGMEERDGRRIMLPERQSLILLGGWRGKVPYYELRDKALERYRTVEPDTVLIEKKVSGISLIQDFKRLGMRVTPVSIDHGGRATIDIKERAELAAPMLADGLVWAPEGPRYQFAEDIIDECSKVPGGKNDDYASTVCMALMWLRRRHELKTWEDADQQGEVRLFKRRRGSIYG
jgi:phage terminase large subunit-like protein